MSDLQWLNKEIVLFERRSRAKRTPRSVSEVTRNASAFAEIRLISKL